MDVDLSTDLAALLPLVAPLISGHSDLAIGTRLSRGSRVVRGAEARGDLPLLQPAAARHAGGPVLRRAVRVQGDPRATSPRACCRWSRTPAGSSTPSCWSSPSAPACASTRCRWTGSTTRTAGSTSSPTALADLQGICAAGHRPRHRRECRSGRLRAELGRDADGDPAGLRAAADQLRSRIGVRQHARVPAAVRCCCAGVLERAGARTWSRCWSPRSRNTAANRRLTFGVRGRRARRTPSAAGAGRSSRIGLGADQRRAARC